MIELSQRHPRRRLSPALAHVLVLSTFASAAHAQSFDLYGVGPKSIAMAGATGSADGDYAATFYNPAQLRQGGVGASFLWSRPFLTIDAAERASPNQVLSRQNPVDYAGVAVGFAVPLIGLLKDKATLGFGVFTPMRHVFRSRMIDESTAYFFRYDNAPERIQILMGTSIRPFPWLSFGIGAQVMSDYGGEARFAAVLGSMKPGAVLRRTLHNEVTGVGAPLVGFDVGPWKGVRLFGSWRGQVLAVYTLPIAVDLGMFGALDITVKGVSHFAPHHLTFGASAELVSKRLFVTAELGWDQWSAVPPLIADIGIHLAGTLIDLGFHPDVASRPLTMGFQDVVQARAALEWRQNARLKLRAGYGLRPTPAPPQTGRTNFVDATAHLISAGVGYTLDDPLLMAEGLSLEAALQLAVLESGKVVKDGNNVNPNYTFGGQVATVNVGARYEF